MSACFIALTAVVVATNPVQTIPGVNPSWVKGKTIKTEQNISPDAFNISRSRLLALAEKHLNLDEHGVTIGGRVNQGNSRWGVVRSVERFRRP